VGEQGWAVKLETTELPKKYQLSPAYNYIISNSELKKKLKTGNKLRGGGTNLANNYQDTPKLKKPLPKLSSEKKSALMLQINGWKANGRAKTQQDWTQAPRASHRSSMITVKGKTLQCYAGTP